MTHNYWENKISNNDIQFNLLSMNYRCCKIDCLYYNMTINDYILTIGKFVYQSEFESNFKPKFKDLEYFNSFHKYSGACKVSKMSLSKAIFWFHKIHNIQVL